MEHSKKAIKIALENGAEYCDIRTEWSQKFGVLVENGLIEQSNSRFISGIGIRVLYNGAWGFFSTSENDGISEGVLSAIKAAKNKIGRAHV